LVAEFVEDQAFLRRWFRTWRIRMLLRPFGGREFLLGYATLLEFTIMRQILSFVGCGLILHKFDEMATMTSLVPLERIVFFLFFLFEHVARSLALLPCDHLVLGPRLVPFLA
jgi:hypothetical protein